MPGDEVKLSLGAVVAADVKLEEGSILLDQSMLTRWICPGRSRARPANVRRGAGCGAERPRPVVTATGARTKFGHTAELVRSAHVVSTQQKTVVRVVGNLAIFSSALIVLLVAYALGRKCRVATSSISCSRPSWHPSRSLYPPRSPWRPAVRREKALARLGVLPTRLSAVDEAATLDVLCSDKTGTLTLDALTVTALRPETGFDEPHLLALAALASSDGGRDPVDAAIRAAAAMRPVAAPAKLTKLVPFDPATKLSEAAAVDARGVAIRAVKGAFAVVSKLAEASPTADAMAQELEEKGFRVLAVAAGSTTLKLAGVIALSDPPRPDAAELIKQLRALGVRTVMVTGDAMATARIIANEVGLEGAICPAGPIPAAVRPEAFAVFAGVMPEDKYHLVQAFQKTGHTVGMCGDGVNDAPALRQAQMGIAVSTATDVAKSAAGIVLTKPGLEGVVAAVKEGRITFQRILTYTINSVTKKIVQVFLLAAGLLITGQAILTPMLMVIIMITGDFLGMALTTDHVKPSPTPSAWRVGDLTLAGIFMGLCELVFCVAVLLVGKLHMGFGIDTLRTLAFVVIVLGNQATMYTNRARQHLVVDRSKPLAGALVGGRSADRSDARESRPRDGIATSGRDRSDLRRDRGVRVPGGLRQSPGVQAARDRLAARRLESGGVRSACTRGSGPSDGRPRWTQHWNSRASPRLSLDATARGGRW